MLHRLQDPEKCMDLIFIQEYSLILTHASKQCQDTSHLPHTRKMEIDLLTQRLVKARDAFGAGNLPDATSISWTEQVS